jgi:Lrp/AsnC family transcriptional regulator, regulator for asnA, asnC and gidA
MFIVVYQLYMINLPHVALIHFFCAVIKRKSMMHHKIDSNRQRYIREMTKEVTKRKSSTTKKSTKAAVAPQSIQQNIDKLSRQILVLLQEDGRRSYSSIARELKVSESAVRARVGHLEEHEHLRFIAVIDPVQVGFGSWAMLGITVASGASPHDLALHFSKHPQAIWVSAIGGKFDLMVEVWLETSSELQEYLEEHCYGNPGVLSVDTMVGMRIYKWGAPQL